MTPRHLATVAQLPQFDEVIDVRSPAEFAEDHIPRALSCPVLSDGERALVGTLYKQESSFAAKRLGAGLVAANIGHILSAQLADRPRAWRPLVYCWRGGQRSAALTHVLREIGWDAMQLAGGYKAYRRDVIERLRELPHALQFRVVSGPTGCGKSHLLGALRALGAQILDLEALAAHKGSLLGNIPRIEQPSQKMFDSLVLARLAGFSAAQPVYVESESKRIGSLRVPDALIARMWQSPCTRVDAPLAGRVEFLLREYAHFTEQPDQIMELLRPLARLNGQACIDRWEQSARSGAWHEFVSDLLQTHYDPAYLRSLRSHYASVDDLPVLWLEDLSAPSLERAARQLHAAVEVTE